MTSMPNQLPSQALRAQADAQGRKASSHNRKSWVAGGALLAGSAGVSGAEVLGDEAHQAHAYHAALAGSQGHHATEAARYGKQIKLARKVKWGAAGATLAALPVLAVQSHRHQQALQRQKSANLAADVLTGFGKAWAYGMPSPSGQSAAAPLLEGVGRHEAPGTAQRGYRMPQHSPNMAAFREAVDAAKPRMHRGVGTATWAGKLPKHSEGAAVLRNSARTARLMTLGKAAPRLFSPAPLPGDNREAQMARTRRTAGLATATGGYLIASRAKDVAPGIAQWATPSTKKIGVAQRAARGTMRPHAGRRLGATTAAAERATQVTRKTTRIVGIAHKTGAATIGAGLLLAGEGAVSDLHHRQALSRVRRDVHQMHHVPVNSPDGLAKAGWSSLFSGGLPAAGRKIGSKLGGMSGGRMGLQAGKSVSGFLKPISTKIAAGGLNPTVMTATGRKLSTAGVGYTAGAAGIGGGVLAGNLMNNKQQPVAKRAQNAVLAKAFNSEVSRHNRQAAYTGGLTGGAVLAGAGSVGLGVAAHRARRAGNAEAKLGAAGNTSVSSGLDAMTLKAPAAPRRTKGQIAAANAKPGPTPIGANAAKPAAKKVKVAIEGAQARTLKNVDALKGTHTASLGHVQSAGRLAGKARKLTRLSVGSALGATALGAAAYGVHDYDRRRQGRTYGYGYGA